MLPPPCERQDFSQEKAALATRPTIFTPMARDMHLREGVEESSGSSGTVPAGSAPGELP